MRDSRITPIYEGTTGIQASDLVGRKIARDGGASARRLLDEMENVRELLENASELAQLGSQLFAGIAALRRCIDFVVKRYTREPKAAATGAVPLLELFGIVTGGWQMARAAIVARKRLAEDSDTEFLRAKMLSARFYGDHVLTQATGLADSVVNGADTVLEYADEQF